MNSNGSPALLPPGRIIATALMVLAIFFAGTFGQAPTNTLAVRPTAPTTSAAPADNGGVGAALSIVNPADGGIGDALSVTQ